LISLNESGAIFIPNVSDNFTQNVYLMTEIKQKVSQQTINLFQQYYLNGDKVGSCNFNSFINFEKAVFIRKKDDICEE
jgi:hypothetical protein